MPTACCLLPQVQSFCINFSRIREAAKLFRLLKQIEAGSRGGDARCVDPATHWEYDDDVVCVCCEIAAKCSAAGQVAGQGWRFGLIIIIIIIIAEYGMVLRLWATIGLCHAVHVNT